jgi:hypothetical protein
VLDGFGGEPLAGLRTGQLARQKPGCVPKAICATPAAQIGYGGSELRHYTEVCGWVLTRAHAKTDDAAMISGYLGKSDRFEEAIGNFADAYGDQNERDHAALAAAVKAGQVVAIIEDSL